MRVLSFIPALLFAATSLVAAAPTSAPSDPATAAPACASTDGTASSNPAIQPVIDAITSATQRIQPLATQLSSAINASPMNQDAVINTLSQIDVVVVATTKDLKSVVATIDWTALDLAAVGRVVVSLVGLLGTVLNALGPYVKLVVAGTVVTVDVVVHNLLVDVNVLVEFLNGWLGPTVGGVVVPVLNLTRGALASVSFLLGVILS